MIVTMNHDVLSVTDVTFDNENAQLPLADCDILFRFSTHLYWPL